jgi:hypothetical protein
VTAKTVLLALLSFVTLAALAACGGDGQPSSPTPTPSAAATTGGTITPTPAGEPTRELAGIKFYTWDAWNGEALGGCPSQNPEGPFLAPAVFSVSDADLASIPVLNKQTIRMCKLAGITVLSFPLSNAQIDLVAGPAQWPSYVPLDSLTVQGDVVVAPSPIITDKNTVLAGNTAVKAAPFGLVIAYSNASTDAAVSALASIDGSQISVPLGNDLFTGDIAGIHFESEFNPAANAQCFYGAYGLGGGGESIVTPSDARVQIEPGYLPPGARPLTTVSYRKCGDQESAEITYFFSATTPGQYWIVRKSGTPEWVSIYAEDWYSSTTVAGLDAALVSPPPGITSDSGAELFVHEAFGLTAIYGPDPAELIKIAEGLNR